VNDIKKRHTTRAYLFKFNELDYIKIVDLKLAKTTIISVCFSMIA